MRLSRILATLSIATLFCCCQPQGVTDLSSFVADNTVRLELDGACIFRYNEKTCQLAYNEQHCEWRAHTDSMLDFFVLTLDGIPEKAGTQYNASLLWSTTSGERTKTNITLNTVRIEGDVVWLCDESCRNAVVVRILE